MQSGCSSISLAVYSVFLCFALLEDTGLPDVCQKHTASHTGPTTPSLHWEIPAPPRGRSHFEPRCTYHPLGEHPHLRSATRSLPSHQKVAMLHRLPSATPLNSGSRIIFFFRTLELPSSRVSHVL